MSVPCYFCNKPVNPYDKGAWVQENVWNSRQGQMVQLLNVQPLVAHNHCVKARLEKLEMRAWSGPTPPVDKNWGNQGITKPSDARRD